MRPPAPSPSAIRRICVFCGSRMGARPVYEASARALGEELARRGLGLVYGGGKVGLMGVLSSAVMGAGGHVIGVIPKRLFDREVADEGISELQVVGSMHERKAAMERQADAFIALPGGFGTFEEFFEVVTWAQLGLHRKPLGLLNVAGYFDPLTMVVDRGVFEGFIPAEHRAIFEVDADPGRLLDKLLAHWVPPLGPRWIDRSET